jgi:hypothetical protein
MNIEENVINPLTRMKVSDRVIDFVLSSKTYISLSDQINEVALISNNTFDLSLVNDYLYAATSHEEDSIKGDLDIYFVDQFLYYNADVTTTEDDFIENGKFKMNLGITQSIWDNIFLFPEELFDNNLDIGINPEELIIDIEMMNFMIDSDMISVYKDKDAYTIVMDITKTKILDNLNNFLDVIMDTTGWDAVDYFENSRELRDTIYQFDKLDLSIIYVIEDDIVKKSGISMDIKLYQEFMKITIVGQIVVDMNVKLPDLPKDLDEYELTDSLLGKLGY